MNLFTRAGAALTLVLAALLFSQQAFAQGTVLQSGPITGRHAPMYVGGFGGNSQAILMDSGPASGGANGLGVSEWLQQSGNPNGGTAVAPSSGSGPFGTHVSLWDTYSANPAGAHFLALDANANGGGLITYGATGTAQQLPLSICANGQCIQFPFVISGIVGPTVSAINDCALWNNTAGTLLKDGGVVCPPFGMAINATTGAAPAVIANTPLNGVYISDSGSNVVWCPIFGASDPLSKFGCPTGSAIGTSSFTGQYAAVMTTYGTANVQENGIFSLVYNQTGQRSLWATNTAFTSGIYAVNGGNLYLQAASNCTSASSGGGPTGFGSAIADNTCLWNYVAPQYAAGKQSANFNVISLAGGGQSWAMTAGNTFEPGWNGLFGTGAEIESQNFSNIDAFQGSGTTLLDLYIGGQIGTHPITSQIYMSKSPNASNPSGFGSYAGISITGPNTIESEDIYLSNTGATAGYYQTGTFGVATFDDVSTAPFALLLNGNYSSAAIRVAPGVTEPWSSQGLFFDGTGHVNAAGFISSLPITTGSAATYACWTSAGILISSASPC